MSQLYREGGEIEREKEKNGDSKNMLVHRYISGEMTHTGKHTMCYRKDNMQENVVA